MEYEITYTRTAAKVLRKLPRNQAEKIVRKVEKTAANLAEAHNVKRLVGNAPATFRLRVDNWRVLFDLIDGTPRVLAVLDIKSRGQAYK